MGHAHLIGLLDILEHLLAVGMIDRHLEDAVLHAHRHDELTDGEVARDGLGDDIHIEIEGLELLERQLQLTGHRAHDGLLVEDLAGGADLHLQGDDDVHQIRTGLVRHLVLLGLAEEFLALLALFQGDELALLRRQFPVLDQDVEKRVAVEQFHIISHGEVCTILMVGPATYSSLFSEV